MSFRSDIMTWPSRAVLAIHDYGCPPHDAAGLARIREGIERREAALLDARTRKGLHLAPTLGQGTADEHLQSSDQPDGDAECPATG